MTDKGARDSADVGLSVRGLVQLIGDDGPPVGRAPFSASTVSP